MIKKVSEHSDFQILAKLLNDSFMTVTTDLVSQKKIANLITHLLPAKH
jgi:hypothetical protein